MMAAKKEVKLKLVFGPDVTDSLIKRYGDQMFKPFDRKLQEQIAVEKGAAELLKVRRMLVQLQEATQHMAVFEVVQESLMSLDSQMHDLLVVLEKRFSKTTFVSQYGMDQYNEIMESRQEAIDRLIEYYEINEGGELR